MIFYFSGTGNSKYIATKIAERQNDRLVSISDCLNNNNLSFTLSDGEQLGFVFPTYFYGIPTIVLDFIGKLDLQSYGNNYTYVVCANGGDSGNLHSMFQKCLSKRNVRLDAAFAVTMPDNYILMFNLLPKPEKIAGILAEAEKLIERVVSDIAESRRMPLKSSFGKWIKTVLSYPMYKYGRNTKHFYATSDCNGCGLCEKLCHSKIISMNNRMPQWKEGKCIQCLSCLHHCPKSAIQHKKRTETRGRYLNPNVK